MAWIAPVAHRHAGSGASSGATVPASSGWSCSCGACVLALVGAAVHQRRELSVTRAPGPFVASPSWDYPLGTDSSAGRSWT